jgi:hypothetical protein
MKKSTITKSVDAPKHISSKDLCACTERAIVRASIAPVLVMLVSESVAARVGIGHTGVIRHHRSTAELPSYYEVWLVGKAGIADYVSTMQGIMNDFHAYGGSSVLKMHA